MKAMVLTGLNEAEYREVPTPECPSDGLLLKIESVGLCGSDVRTFGFGHAHVKYPCILGHENVGEIVEVGKEVEGFKVGERLLVNPVLPCGKCWYCLNGLQNLCEKRDTYGHELPGGFAQYMAIPGYGLERGQVIKLKEGDDANSMVVVELLSSVINAQEYANVSLGETVVIIGTGPIGCLHSEIARLRGAKQIIMADLNSERLDMCKKFSGTHFINSGEKDLKEEVMKLTDNFGADVCIVAAPSTAAHQQGLTLLRKRGRLLIFGGLNKDNPWSKMDGNLIHYNELQILGTFAYGPSNFKKAFDIVSHKMINTGIVTDVIPLKDMVKGVEKIRAGKSLKVVMKPWQE